MKSIKNIAVIQFYFYPDISAVSQMLHDLLTEIAKDNRLNITVFAGRSAYQQNSKIEQSVKKFSGITIKRFFTFNFGKKNLITRLLDYSFYYSNIFIYFLFSRKWDIIVCLTSPPFIGFVTSLSLLFKKTIFIQYIQDLYPEILFDLGLIKSPWLTRKMQFLNRISFRRSNRIVTISRYMTNRLLKHQASLRKKIFEINNWAKDIEYESGGRFDFNKTFRIMYSGNMGLSHDFSILPDLIERLKKYKNIEYIFIGGGQQKRYLQKKISKVIENQVTFMHYAPRKKISNNLASADLLVIAQKKETIGDILPSKLYAYLASGRPMLFLGPRISEIGEVIIQNDLGVVCESEYDIDGVIDYIVYLMKHPHICKAIGQRSRDLFESKYKLKYSVHRFNSLITDLDSESV